jgi:4-carboxymuconolactone decarboxylase
VERLEPVAATADDPILNPVFDVFRNAGREVPMLYRLLGNSPAMLEAWVGLAWPLRSKPTTSRALRELLIMQLAVLTRASFEWQAHWSAAVKAGVTPAQLAALGSWSSSELFDEPTKAALRCSEEMLADGGASAEAVATLRGYFNDGECVELILTSAFYACVSHVLLTIGIEADAAHGDASEECIATYAALTA